jgi:hypothetical protein
MFKLKVGATATFQDDLEATRHGIWILDGTFVEKGQLFRSKAGPGFAIQVTRIVPISDFDKAAILISQCHKLELKDREFGDREVSFVHNGRLVGTGYFGHSERRITLAGMEFLSSEAYKVDAFGAKTHSVVWNDEVHDNCVPVQSNWSDED